MLLALDFDGVVIDGADECLLVAWNVFHNNPVNEFNNEKLLAIPSEFKSMFRKYRSYIRHDGHFIVPFYNNPGELITSNSFTEAYDLIPSDIRDEFRQKFIMYRDKARQAFPKFWAKLHSPLIDIARLFGLGHEIKIVSGKDSQSITTILEQQGVNMASVDIYGRMVNKSETLKKIKSESDSKNTKMIFVDDNIENVIEAKKLGINTFWANWGYRSPEHQNIALSHTVTEISSQALFEFLMTMD